MKNTGMIRRVDELGRIVIPKEIRSTFGLKTGSPLDISVNQNGAIVLNTKNMMNSIKDKANELSETLESLSSIKMAIVDKDRVVSVCNMSNKNIDTKISKEIIEYIDKFDIIKNNQTIQNVKLFDSDGVMCTYVLPILSQTICVGAVICTNENITEFDKLALKFIATYLSKQVE
ncbi:MAG: AbrB/MazE/SpoVT family DNA-binding domain-containing protein [Clostridia bacterium]|nr:AbrB/MazE/SpoVT family DNA-binding domain-containing protein [Clostridia bacterium]